jgi:release factor glutamine methyltransferase
MSADLQLRQLLPVLPGFGPVRRAIGRLMYWRFRLFEKRTHAGVVLERIAGTALVVMPEVLNPRLMRTGEFFAAQLTPELIPGHAEVLDMGTGSGVCAVFAARCAQRVVAVDINPAAVRCARANVLLNALESRIDVLQGDLFAPLAERRFDVVLFNPPFVLGTPRDDADRAWRSTDVAQRFAGELKGHLKPSGFALVLLSTYGDAGAFIREFHRAGFSMSVVAGRSFINEKLTLLKLI